MIKETDKEKKVEVKKVEVKAVKPDAEETEVEETRETLQSKFELDMKHAQSPAFNQANK